jgi:thiamine kinase-like enzyme
VEPDAERAVALLGEATGEDFELVGRLSGGETGAHEVRHRSDGERLVLKWETESGSQVLRRDGVELAERLRTRAGWPVPRQRVVEVPGCLLVLQDFMAGDPVRALTPALADELLRLHRSRLGLGDQRAGSVWAARLIRTLVVGGEDYCQHQPLRDHDTRTAALVREVEALGARMTPGDFASSDIVHWDLHPGNLLAKEGRLSAVVDTDFCTVGDASFDLVMLALTSTALPCGSDVRRVLLRRALIPLPPVRRAAYLGHLFVRLLDWPIRRGSADEVEHWLSQVERCRRAGYFLS